VVDSNYNSIIPSSFYNLSLCGKGEFYKDGYCSSNILYYIESLFRVSNCLLNLDGYRRCLKCDNDYLYDEETSLCVSKCRNNSYEDKLNKICRKCHKKCSRCYGPNENNCFECPGFPFFPILNGTNCIRNCENDEIFINPLTNCIKGIHQLNKYLIV
jgi:hypothetical protein